MKQYASVSSVLMQSFTIQNSDHDFDSFNDIECGDTQLGDTISFAQIVPENQLP